MRNRVFPDFVNPPHYTGDDYMTSNKDDVGEPLSCPTCGRRHKDVSVLSRDWDTPEEDAAWDYLSKKGGDA